MLKTYKTLSVLEPWGDFIARGVKTIEVRSWTTDEISPGEDLLIVQNKRCLSPEDPVDQDGHAVALVRLSEIRPFVYEDRPAAKTERFEDNWWAWVLTDLRPIKGRVRAPAKTMIYELSLDLNGESLA